MVNTPGEAPSQASTPGYHPCVVLLAATCVGIIADLGWGIPAASWWVACTGACGGWLGLRRGGYDRLAGLVLLVAVAALAGGWHHCRWSLFAEDDLGRFAREEPAPVCVEAVAVQGVRAMPAPAWDPMRVIPRGDRTRLELAVTAIRDGAAWRSASGRTELYVEGHALGIRAGDRIRVFGRLARPRVPLNPGQRDYASHLRADRQCCLLRTGYPDAVSVVDRASSWNPWYWVPRAQSEVNTLLWKHLGPRHRGLAASLLLGDRAELEPRRVDAFQETGTIHLLSVSGLHVGIVVLAAGAVGRWIGLSRRRTALAMAATAVFYTFLTDAQPPAVRAMILVLVACAAAMLGRRGRSPNALAAAALVVLALNPADLFRIGPQLSFLATAAIMWYVSSWLGSLFKEDPLARLIDASRPWPSRAAWGFWHSLRHLTLVSLAVWIVVEPLIMARFHLVTPVAIVLNTLLWIPVAVALWSGFVVLGLSWVCPPLASFAAWVCDGSLGLIDVVVGYARAMPLGHVWAPGPADWWLIGFYGALGAWAAWPRFCPARRWCAAILIGWAGVGFGAAAWPEERPALDCTFLAVGHGCSVFMELPDGRTILYDAGCLTSPQQAVDTIAEFLWARGLMHVDAVVLSHADADHYNALPELARRFSIGTVWVSPMMFYEENASLRALRESLALRGVPVAEVWAGHALRATPECRIEALHPPERGSLGGDNANSLVLLVEAFGRRVLLLGDLESQGLADLVAEEPVDCDVLMVPHHGSRNSNPPGLAQWCRPERAIISGSLGYDPAPTEAAYRRAGAEVFHTGRVGAVRVRCDAEGVHTSAWLRDGWKN